MDAQPLYPFRKIPTLAGKLSPTVPMKTQLKAPLATLADAIIRLHKTSVPSTSCSATSALAKTYLPFLDAATPPDWFGLKKTLEGSFGKKQALKKVNIQGGINGITLVLRVFERLDLEGVGNHRADCVSWIDKLVKAVDSQAEIYRQLDASTELARLSLYANAPANTDVPRSSNPSALANFPSHLLDLVLEQTFEPRSTVESSFEPTANNFDRQNTRRVFQRVCHSWSGIVNRQDVAVKGAAQLNRLRLAFERQEGGRTAQEVRGLTVDFRADSRANFEACGKALGELLEVCVNLEMLEIVLPGPAVDGEEVVGLASLASALDKTAAKVEKFILRCVPEMRRNRDGSRKFAPPLVLRLSILSPIICRTGLKHLEIHGITVAKARLATKVQCRLLSFRCTWNGDNSSLFALLSASKNSIKSIAILEAIDPEAFSRVDLAEFLVSIAPTLRDLTLIECDKGISDPNYIEKFLSDMQLKSLQLGSAGYTATIFEALKDCPTIQHITIELTRQFAPPTNGLWCLSEYLKSGNSKGLKSFRIVPEPSAKVLMGNGSVWKLDRAAERGGIKLLLPSGWRI